ncbi:uncharacterized protein EV420DRAFT_520690 [Desarmillaria tabescens]|uniref:Heterokaryon incompatibility domain-containing protein n=1 Tax=Armillaria tabescens TaxID=1929756 RepID=A0AA39N4U7_ARMTA|nr:uncharacterized protein EV420DRAFT_520690 [Desarmillaria tabescens]KAK0457325.1 hypothetical protein EV420DRAFT_520690 [Desarmillaria tabescens]
MMDRLQWFERYGDYIIPPNRFQQGLSAFTETGQAESPIPVLKQRFYTGRKSVIPSSLANVLCADIGIDELLEKLNTILGTSYTLENRPLSSLLENYIAKGYDFGTVYAHLRPVWYNDLTTIENHLRTCEARDREMRQDVLANNRIITTMMPPRRVWHLYSNRVVPWWIAHQWPRAISHAWMEEKDCADVQTPINGYRWSVSIPKGVNLNLIRIEMLNLGAEYVWLDVLCLRQAGGWREDLRVEEWKVDVPTIGWVYRSKTAACYFNGLGRPLSMNTCSFESDRSWFRRAWTLQEFCRDLIIVRDTSNNGIVEGEIRVRYKQMSSLQSMQKEGDVFDMLSGCRRIRWI